MVPRDYKKSIKHLNPQARLVPEKYPARVRRCILKIFPHTHAYNAFCDDAWSSTQRLHLTALFSIRCHGGNRSWRRVHGLASNVGCVIIIGVWFMWGAYWYIIHEAGSYFVYEALNDWHDIHEWSRAGVPDTWYHTSDQHQRLKDINNKLLSTSFSTKDKK